MLLRQIVNIKSNSQNFRIQELHFQLDESQKEQEKLNSLAEKLQVKVQGYKKQAVEAVSDTS